MSQNNEPLTEHKSKFNELNILHTNKCLLYGEEFTLRQTDCPATFRLFMDGQGNGIYSLKMGIIATKLDEKQPVYVRVEFWVEDSEGNKVCKENVVEQYKFKFSNQRYEFEPNGSIETDFFDNALEDGTSAVCCCKLTFLGYDESFPTLGQKLWKLHEEGTQLDATILAGDKEFKVSSLILSAQSSVLREMITSPLFLEGQSKTIKIEDVPANVIEVFIKWLYTEELEIDENDEKLVEELYAAADKYLVEDLKFRCGELIYEGLDEENSARRLNLASMHNDKKLEKKIAAFIEDNFPECKYTES